MIQLTYPIGKISGFSAIICFLAFLIVLFLEKYINNFNDVWTLIRYISLNITITSSVIFLVNYYLWYSPFFRKSLNIPLLHGRWEGWYFNNITNEWNSTAHEIEQKGPEFTIIAYGGPGNKTPVRSNKSIGIVSGITIPKGSSVGKNRLELHWTYYTQNTREAGGNHIGVHIMNLTNINGHHFLKGQYINNRIWYLDKKDKRNTSSKNQQIHGSTGEIILMKTDKPLSGECLFDETNWAIERPTKPPKSTHLEEIMLNTAKKLKT